MNRYKVTQPESGRTPSLPPLKCAVLPTTLAAVKTMIHVHPPQDLWPSSLPCGLAFHLGQCVGHLLLPLQIGSTSFFTLLCAPGSWPVRTTVTGISWSLPSRWIWSRRASVGDRQKEDSEVRVLSPLAPTLLGRQWLYSCWLIPSVQSGNCSLLHSFSLRSGISNPAIAGAASFTTPRWSSLSKPRPLQTAPLSKLPW